MEIPFGNQLYFSGLQTKIRRLEETQIDSVFSKKKRNKTKKSMQGLIAQGMIVKKKKKRGNR